VEHPAHYVLSVDVEDYFHVEAFAKQVSRSDWDQYPSRVVPNTQRVLDLFDDMAPKERTSSSAGSRRNSPI